jgi:hypothetical protein
MHFPEFEVPLIVARRSAFECAAAMHVERSLEGEMVGPVWMQGG